MGGLLGDGEPCLHGYAQSSEMYTHVGTAPRTQSQKKSRRGAKETKSKEREEEKAKRMNRGNSQWKAEERVQHSPLLHALSNHSLTSLDQPPSSPAASRPLPCTPAPGRTSPLTSPPNRAEAPSRGKDTLDTDGCLRKSLIMAARGAKAASPQDLYVPMDPIYESTQMAEQTKTQRLKQETTKPASEKSQEVDINR